jgi:hypothetical protein
MSEDSDEDLVLTDVEKRALIALLKRTIDEARFPYSPQLAPLKVILAKLVPPVPRPEPRPVRAGLGPQPWAWEAETVNRYTGPPMTLGAAASCSRSPDRVVPRLPAPGRARSG